MFRIDVQRGADSTSITLEGKLKGRCVEELEKCWRTEISSAAGQPIEMKLAAVSFVDTVGRELLIRMRQGGVRLVPTGCFMTAIVAGIEAEVLNDKS
jgi:hypothetical protein